MAKTEEGVQDRVVLEYPTDLLKTLVSRKFLQAKEDMEELSLGLSSNGRFGVDPKDAKLARSSSIPCFNGGSGEEEAVVPNGFSSASSLVRARSLPAEAAEWRTRKEMQSLRMKEAKRKRAEEQGSLKGVTDQIGDNGGWRRINGSLNRFSGIGIWGLDCISSATGGGFGWNGSDEFSPLPHPPKTSVGSQGNGSEPGNNFSGEAQSHASNQPSPESDQKQPAGPEKEVEIAGVGKVTQTKAKELMSRVFVDMPCVSTMGEGPNGERVEGFLYRYRKLEEVTIVCVCHGRFFSPAEFIRHAGGCEVENPLKHIIISPSF